MDGGGEARTCARLDEMLRRIQERKDAEAAQDGSPGTENAATQPSQGTDPPSPLVVRAGRDIVFGGGRPANDEDAALAPHRRPSLELHYALLGLVSFAVLLLLVVVFLLARRDLRPIKPSGATSVSAVILLNPCDAAFFLFLFGPMALKTRSNAPFSPLHPALSRHVPRRSNHLSLHIEHARLARALGSATWRHATAR